MARGPVFSHPLGQRGHRVEVLAEARDGVPGLHPEGMKSHDTRTPGVRPVHVTFSPVTGDDPQPALGPPGHLREPGDEFRRVGLRFRHRILTIEGGSSSRELPQAVDEAGEVPHLALQQSLEQVRGVAIPGRRRLTGDPLGVRR